MVQIKKNKDKDWPAELPEHFTKNKFFLKDASNQAELDSLRKQLSDIGCPDMKDYFYYSQIRCDECTSHAGYDSDSRAVTTPYDVKVQGIRISSVMHLQGPWWGWGKPKVCFETTLLSGFWGRYSEGRC